MIYYTVSPNNYIYFNANASLNFNNIVVNHTYMSFTFKILKKNKKTFLVLETCIYFLKSWRRLRHRRSFVHLHRALSLVIYPIGQFIHQSGRFFSFSLSRDG